MIRHVASEGGRDGGLMFWCPGCEIGPGVGGLHMLPISGDVGERACWTFDGNLEDPTLNPSILTGRGTDFTCHSFLHAGIFNFLGDCTHALANQHVPAPPLPDGVMNE